MSEACRHRLSGRLVCAGIDTEGRNVGAKTDPLGAKAVKHAGDDRVGSRIGTSVGETFGFRPSRIGCQDRK